MRWKCEQGGWTRARPGTVRRSRCSRHTEQSLRAGYRLALLRFHAVDKARQTLCINTYVLPLPCAFIWFGARASSVPTEEARSAKQVVMGVCTIASHSGMLPSFERCRECGPHLLADDHISPLVLTLRFRPCHTAGM